EEDAIINIVDSSANWQDLKRRYENSLVEDLSLPAGFTASLREYQTLGYKWLLRLCCWETGALLADDMGLGKTIQTLAVLLKKAQNGPSMIICPTSLIFNWCREAEKFAPCLNTVIYSESDRTSQSLCLKPFDLLLVSYGLVQRDIERLSRADWNILVIDEAQAVKNDEAKTTRAVRQIRARWKVALSGTPVENNLKELWSLFRTVCPGLLGSFESFKTKYILPIERYGNVHSRERLRAVIRPFILRRLKNECLSELPEKTYVDAYVDLSPEERAVYDVIRVQAIDKIRENSQKAETSGRADSGRFDILAALTRLRLAACHPGLVLDEGSYSSSKLEYLRELCQRLKDGGHKALIFSQFTSFLSLIGDLLDDMEFTYMVLEGGSSTKEREKMVGRFQAGETDFFLISLKAGGYGLNLTRADYVIHMDPWWNPAVEDQATDRAYRMGQANKVTVYRIIGRGTVEETIMKIHDSKRDLATRLLEGTSQASALTREEMLKIMEVIS
ncbi:MAG: DEAD/DEAH box helicase, partial [Oligoflexales bacterium]|nr:DEAD/DEAH box helicase [Oligoflexales bacterium]